MREPMQRRLAATARDAFVIGTRGSALALWQASAVKSALERAFPEARFELRVVKTTGDVTLERPLHEIGGNGVFTKQLEAALVVGEVDLCVHSMKDVPSELAPGCAIGAMLPRADVRDALVCGPRLEGVRGLADLPTGARIGTGSLRRAALLAAHCPQVEVVGLRGNVDTRLAKATGPDMEGAVLACAGIERMGKGELIRARLPVNVMIPAAGQGAIGVEVRVDDEEAAVLCRALDDAPTHACVGAEREVLAALGGSCKVPMGVYARLEDGRAQMDAVVLSADGSRQVRSHREAPVEEGLQDACADGAPQNAQSLAGPLSQLARNAVRELEERGAREILAGILGSGDGAVAR